MIFDPMVPAVQTTFYLDDASGHPFNSLKDVVLPYFFHLNSFFYAEIGFVSLIKIHVGFHSLR